MTVADLLDALEFHLIFATSSSTLKGKHHRDARVVKFVEKVRQEEETNVGSYENVVTLAVRLIDRSYGLDPSTDVGSTNPEEKKKVDPPRRASGCFPPTV